MAFREVAMFEVKEIIRLFGEGAPKKAIARVVGVDPKTVRSYNAAAESLGLAGLLDDEGLARLLRELRIDVVERPHGEAWRRSDEHRDAVKKWLDDGVKLTKVRKLLERRDVLVPYPTLHRFAVEQLEFGRRRHSVRGRHRLRLAARRREQKAFIFTPTLSRYRFIFVVERETTEAAIEACEAAWPSTAAFTGRSSPTTRRPSSTSPARPRRASSRPFSNTRKPATLLSTQLAFAGRKTRDASSGACSSSVTTASAAKTRSSRARTRSGERWSGRRRRWAFACTPRRRSARENISRGRRRRR